MPRLHTVLLLFLWPNGVYCLSPNVQIGTLSVAPLALGTLNHFEVDSAHQLLRDVAPPSVLLDTAELYGKGQTEAVLENVASRAGVTLGEDAFVATKFAPSFVRVQPSSVVDACLASAKRLNVEQIDLYQIHYAASKVQLPWFPEIRDEVYWEGLADCYDRGLVRNVGVCNYGPTMIRRCHAYLQERGIPLVSNQINFNLMRYSAALDTKQVCDELGIRILAYHPVGKGTLAGTYDFSSKKTMPEGGRYYRMKRWLKGTVDLRQCLRRIADYRNKTASQIAINWIVQKGAIPICGSRNLEQAKENMGSIGWSLNQEEIEELEAASYLCIESFTILDREFKLV